MAADGAIKNHSAERRLFMVRLVVAIALMFAMLGGLVARMGYLQIFEHGYFNTRSNANRMRVQVVAPVRGLIYDRNGVVLADNVTAYNLEVIPEDVTDLQAELRRLAKIITITKEDKQQFLKRVHAAPSFRPVPLRLDLNKQEVARFEVSRGKFPGMHIRAGLTRNYPLGKKTAHIVGYVGAITKQDLQHLNSHLYRGTSLIGKAGVEKSYEPLLHGRPGSRVVATNATGRILRTLQFHPPKPGRNLYLTLDAHLQQVAYQALGDEAGSVVAINPRTGAILAMVSKPSFNPNIFIGGISSKQYHALLDSPRNPMFNRSLQGEFPPGSTVKPVMAIAGLETGSVNPDRKVFCPGYITLPGSSRRFHGWDRAGMGWVDLNKAIYRSSDVYFYKLAIKMGIDPIAHYDKLFGFGHKTDIDLPHENPGLVPSPAWKRATRGKSWYPGETLNTVIGQGYMTATPLQLAHMTALIASRGIGHVPHILMSSENPDTNKITTNPIRPTKPIKLHNPRHWDIVIKGMKDVIQARHGTAHYYIGRDPAYSLAGKSGTSQVVGLPQYKPAPNAQKQPWRYREHALFIAFGPVRNPQIAVAVVVQHAGGGGSSTASPIAKTVIDAYLKSTGTPPESKS